MNHEVAAVNAFIWGRLYRSLQPERCGVKRESTPALYTPNTCQPTLLLACLPASRRGAEPATGEPPLSMAPKEVLLHTKRNITARDNVNTCNSTAAGKAVGHFNVFLTTAAL